MIGGKVSGLDPHTWERIEKANEAGAKKALKDLAATQRDLIYAQERPDGGKQQDNADSTIRRKKRRNRPLYDKGILADPKQWVVRKRDWGITLRPPASREAAVAVLKSLGYQTVFDELPDEFNKVLQDHLDKQHEKANRKART